MILKTNEIYLRAYNFLKEDQELIIEKKTKFSKINVKMINVPEVLASEFEESIEKSLYELDEILKKGVDEFPPHW